MILAVIIQAFINIQKRELETKIDVLSATMPAQVLVAGKSGNKLVRLEHQRKGPGRSFSRDQIVMEVDESLESDSSSKESRRKRVQKV